MKKTTLLKTMLLLCALVAGSGSVWAQSDYELVTSTTELEDNGVYLIVSVESSSKYYALSGANSNNRKQVELTVSDGKITVTPAESASDNAPFEITLKKSGDNWNLYDAVNEKYLNGGNKKNESTNNNHLKTEATVVTDTGNGKANGVWSISSINNETGVATITNQNSWTIKYNSSNSIFASYSSGQKDVCLYKKIISSDPSSDVAFANPSPSITFPATTTYTQAATTATGYTGTITYEIIANTAGASLDGTTITVTQEGCVTVKATAPKITGYTASTASYTLTVTDSRSDNELAYETPVQTVTIGNILTSPTLTNPNNLSISYSSSDDDIATVDASGNVTGVAKGSAIITATFAGNATYKAGSASYTIKVKKAAPAGAIFYESFDNYSDAGGNDGTWNNSSSTVIKSANNNILTDNTGWTFSTTYPANECVKLSTSSTKGSVTTPSISFKEGKNYSITFKAGAWKNDTNTSLAITTTAGTLSIAEVNTTTETWNTFETILTATGAGTITFGAKVDSKNRIFFDEVVIKEIATITLDSRCTDGEKFYSTYSNSNAFIVPEGLTVSEISVIDNELRLENYDTGDVVPANTGVMVSAATAGDKTFTLTTGGTSKLGSGNLLKPSGDADITAADMAEDNTKFYRLTMHDGSKIGFWWGAEDGAAFALAANKAYLAVPTGTAAPNFFWFGGETTAIRGIENGELRIENGAVFNLAGQRVAQPTKGLYIVNGRKVVIK